MAQAEPRPAGSHAGQSGAPGTTGVGRRCRRPGRGRWRRRQRAPRDRPGQFGHVVLQNQVLSPLKTTASRRVIPADDLVLNAVTAHMRRWAPGPGGLLVTNRCARPVQRNSFGHCWHEAIAAARTCGRPPAPPRERGTCAEGGRADPAHCLPAGTRYQDLRHFYASTLIAAGLHPKAIQSRLGHATIAETMDTITPVPRRGRAGPRRDRRDVRRAPVGPAECRGVTPSARQREMCALCVRARNADRIVAAQS